MAGADPAAVPKIRDLLAGPVEAILRDGSPVGYLTSGGYGYTLERSIGYGYVRNPEGVSDDFLRSGRYEIVVASEAFPAEIGLEPFYDPTNARVKA